MRESDVSDKQGSGYEVESLQEKCEIRKTVQYMKSSERNVRFNRANRPRLKQ